MKLYRTDKFFECYLNLDELNEAGKKLRRL
jgi:hypothetical protein